MAKCYGVGLRLAYSARGFVGIPCAERSYAGMVVVHGFCNAMREALRACQPGIDLVVIWLLCVGWTTSRFLSTGSGFPTVV